jgi:glucose-6-phosphate isomerase
MLNDNVYTRAAIMKSLTEQPAWLALNQHYQAIKSHTMRDWFANDQNRDKKFALQVSEIRLDYSRNRIDDQALRLLIDLATSMNLKARINALFTGELVNTTENRPALHTALRAAPDSQPHDPSIAQPINSAQALLNQFVEAVHSGFLLSVTNKPFKHIVNIGIGGSYLGPLMCTEALKDFAVSDYTFHFMSTVDPDHVRDILIECDPETTLFIVSSKSFTTIETLTNARTARDWLIERLGEKAWATQSVAITANEEKARHFGMDANKIFPFWDWVGGRYSIWSAIGLPLLLQLGTTQFKQFLNGAAEMDKHFHEAPLDKNMPVILALLGVWYNNYFHTTAQAIVPYSYRLRSFVSYIQQLEMESNGKSVDLNGQPLSYATCPIIFGAEGCNSQHSFYQLLHQGRHLVPIDFIIINQPHAQSSSSHHDVVLASVLSQSYAFTRGKTLDEATTELIALGQSPAEAALLAQHLEIEGNKPNNLLMLDRLTPKNLGALIALYEHKIFTQSVIWNINAFDQWGVELGKKNLPAILKQLTHQESTTFTDAATVNLIASIKKPQGVS